MTMQGETLSSRWLRPLGTLDVATLGQPAALIFNPNAGQKFGLPTNRGGLDELSAALRAVDVPFDPWPTEGMGHATVLARRAVAEGRQLVVAAGGDGTVAEVAQALAGSRTVLGIMPLGSVMNVARTLSIPRDLDGAARIIRDGRVLAMDLGRVGTTYFLEAAGVGLDAGLHSYLGRLDRGGPLLGTLRATVRFLRGIGVPRLAITADDRRLHLRAAMVTIANTPFSGAAYVLAPEARVDDGLLNVVALPRTGVFRTLVHLASVAGGRQRVAPPPTLSLHVRAVAVATRGRRPLPVHADGVVVGTPPATFEIVPAALNVLVGPTATVP